LMMARVMLGSNDYQTLSVYLTPLGEHTGAGDTKGDRDFTRVIKRGHQCPAMLPGGEASFCGHKQ